MSYVPGRVAVIAHRGKTLDGGLDELRRQLTVEQVDDLLWFEVPKSRKAPAKARRAVKRGARLILVWGGDGMVQRCLDALVGTDARVAIVPAGTANLLAHNLGIPHDLGQAVQIALYGRPHRLDLGRFNGEHFAVMAGIGFDADMIRDVDGTLKERLGRLAYIWGGLRESGAKPTKMTIKIDGTKWFAGRASCVLVGNVGSVFGGVTLFDDARPDDSWLDVGVTTAAGRVQWARVLGRVSTGRSDRSPLISITRAKRIAVKTHRPLTYELDGGDREKVRRVKIRVVPGAVTVCVPRN